METMGQQGVQEEGEEGGLEAVHGFSDQVRNVVGTGGGGIGGLGKGPGYFLRGKGSIVFVSYEAEEQGRWGFVGEEVVKERLCYLGLIRGPWQVWEPLWWATKREPFGRPEGVWSG